MKKTYIQPEAAVVSVNLIGTILQEDPGVNPARYSMVTDGGDAKGYDGFVDDDEGMSYNNFKDLDMEMSKDSKWGLE